MSDVETLNWESYPNFHNIQTDSGFTVLIGRHGDDADEQVTQLYEKCKKYFPNSTFREVEYRPEIIIQNRDKIANITTTYNCIRVRFFTESKQLQEILYEECLEDSKFFVEIPHKEISHEFKKTSITAISKTGYQFHQDETELFSFWKFSLNGAMVAEMLMNYCAHEMGECTATILLFEVIPEFRNKGLGKKIISEIECFVFKEGFVNLRLDNTQSMEFWEKLGYEIDLDEGDKDLTDLMLDDDCDDI
jgi:GNAT superfamily N-acetyltransferase